MNSIGLILIVLIASTLQAGTGFGFSIMATPFLLLFFEAHSAIQLNIILSLAISLVMTFKIHKDVDRGKLTRLVKGSLIGALPGLMLYIFLDVRPLKLLVSVLILLLTGLLLAKVKLRQSNRGELLAGILSGLLTTSLGMPGPPLLIYFAGAKVDKATIRSTTLLYFVFIYSASLLLQISAYSISRDVWLSTLMALPFTLLGIYLGQWIFVRLNERLFQSIIYILLFFTGAYLLFTTL